MLLLPQQRVCTAMPAASDSRGGSARATGPKVKPLVHGKAIVEDGNGTHSVLA
eukprot:g6081.t1